MTATKTLPTYWLSRRHGNRARVLHATSVCARSEQDPVEGISNVRAHSEGRPVRICGKCLGAGQGSRQAKNYKPDLTPLDITALDRWAESFKLVKLGLVVLFCGLAAVGAVELLPWPVLVLAGLALAGVAYRGLFSV